MNIVWIAAIVAAVLVGIAALMRHGSNGNVVTSGGYVPRFPLDPNKELAIAAPPVSCPGYRRIVSASAAGDYHSETARSESVMVAEAMASADRTAAVVDYFLQRRAERGASSLRRQEEEPVIVKAPPAEPAKPVRTAEEIRREEKDLETKKAALFIAIERYKKASESLDRAKEERLKAQGAKAEQAADKKIKEAQDELKAANIALEKAKKDV